MLFGPAGHASRVGFGTGTAGRERSKDNSKRISLIFAFVSCHGQSYPLGDDLGFLKGIGREKEGLSNTK